VQLPEILQGELRKRLVRGAVAGALAAVIIGFNWGGWTLERSAKQMAVKDTSAALAAVLAPMCAEKFRGGSEGALNMTEFKKVNSWQQESYIQKGGWATFPGMSSPDLAIAQACANLLANIQ
jgi:hypothetical protein